VQRLNQKLRTFFPVLESISESSDSQFSITVLSPRETLASPPGYPLALRAGGVWR